MTEATEMPIAPMRNLNRGKVGMTCLICSEITFFGTLLVTYLFYLGRDIGGPYPDEVLDISLAPMKVGFNSIFLLTSSIWIVLAVKALRKGKMAQFGFWCTACRVSDAMGNPVGPLCAECRDLHVADGCSPPVWRPSRQELEQISQI